MCDGSAAERRVHDAYVADHARLWRSLLAFTGSRDIADDAAAEAFAQALRRGDAIDDVSRWVWKSAFAIARGSLAERSRQRPLEPSHDVDSYANRGDDTDLERGVADALRLLDRLPQRDRELLVLCHLGGWRPRELAPLLGVTAPTLRVRLHRANRRARALLSEEETR